MRCRLTLANAILSQRLSSLCIPMPGNFLIFLFSLSLFYFLSQFDVLFLDPKSYRDQVRIHFNKWATFYFGFSPWKEIFIRKCFISSFGHQNVNPNISYSLKFQLPKSTQKQWDFFLYYIHFEITGDPCSLIGSQQCDLFPNRTIFCSKLHLFPSQWKTNTKTAQPNRFQILFKVTNQIAGKMDVIKG